MVVVKVDGKVRIVREEQPKNIPFMFVALAVVKVDGSVRVVRAEQLENIWDMLPTLLVLNVERLREVREEQPENISHISMTEEVFAVTHDAVLIEFRLVHPKNQCAIFVGMTVVAMDTVLMEVA